MAAKDESKPTPSAISPTPTSQPPALTRPPSLCMKPMPAAASPPPSATSPQASLTTKQWIVPPRPKPGRKPATDTPPTKRKAQNRAAQRAFRERRAARVGELEEQLKQIEDENEQEQDNLRLNISELQANLERCQADLATWISKCRKLEVELAESRRQTAKQNAHASSSSVRSRDVNRTAGPSHAEDEHSYGCGKCTIDSHCQCIDDVVQAMNGNIDGSEIDKRPASPSTETAHKRIKTEPADSNEMEIDFTAAYSKATTNPPQLEATSPTSAVADPCGFCQDGTPCICAEMALEQERRAARPASPLASNHPTARQLAQFTPPPSEGDVANSNSSVVGACGSKPGTCAQCRADPNSTLFCKSLAASREQSTATPQGCCGGKGADGGCCQGSVSLPTRNTRSRTAAANHIQLPPPHSKAVTLTCADAYTALSRHSAYERASSEMASWMPKLHANPAASEGRPAMEIDAANVMAVLKDFDRRFGADK